MAREKKFVIYFRNKNKNKKMIDIIIRNTDDYKKYEEELIEINDSFELLLSKNHVAIDNFSEVIKMKNKSDLIAEALKNYLHKTFE